MQNLFNGKLYMDHQVQMDKFPITKIFTVDANMAYNPVKVCIEAFDVFMNLDLLMLANNIQNPYEELEVGKIIIVPDLRYGLAEIKQPADAKVPTMKLKHATVQSNKITF